MLCQKETVPRGAGTSPQLAIRVTQCWVQHYTEHAALEVLQVQPEFLLKSLNYLASNNVEATELIRHADFR